MAPEPMTGIPRKFFFKALLGLAGAGVPLLAGAASRAIIVRQSPRGGFQYREGECPNGGATIMKVRCLVLLPIALLLAACGGGSGNSDATTPDPGAESLVWDQGAWDQNNWH